MAQKKKIFGFTLFAGGTTVLAGMLIYASTAFVIPFPTEFLSYFIAEFILGEYTTDNITLAYAILWILGGLMLVSGIMLYRMSNEEIAIIPKTMKNGRKLRKH